jgi:DNA-binding transcriptional regulator YhcF (GntR family)
VAGEIRRAIAEGEAKPGERLPPARDLAAELEVNRNTVLRALRQLRDEGLLEFRRGRGITVVAAPEHGVVVVQARELVRLAGKHGYRMDELIKTHREHGLRETPCHRSPGARLEFWLCVPNRRLATDLRRHEGRKGLNQSGRGVAARAS